MILKSMEITLKMFNSGRMTHMSKILFNYAILRLTYRLICRNIQCICFEYLH